MAITRESAVQSLKIVLATFIAFALPIGVVSYLYIQQKTAYFNHRKLRQLSFRAEQTRAVVENYANNVLPSIAKDFPGALETGSNFDLISVGPDEREKRAAPEIALTPFQEERTLWIRMDYWAWGR